MANPNGFPSDERVTFRFKGGDGSSLSEAVKIVRVTKAFHGVLAEFHYIQKKLGKRGKNWEIVEQTVLYEDGYEDGKHYDQIEVALRDGTTRTFFFDISDFFGKW